MIQDPYASLANWLVPVIPPLSVFEPERFTDSRDYHVAWLAEKIRKGATVGDVAISCSGLQALAHRLQQLERAAAK